MINLIKDINLLLEDFSFQSRNIKGRQGQKEKIKEDKIKKFWDKLGDINKVKYLIKETFKKYYEVLEIGGDDFLKEHQSSLFIFILIDNRIWFNIFISLDNEMKIDLVINNRGDEDWGDVEYESRINLPEISFDNIRKTIQEFLNTDIVKLKIKNAKSNYKI